MENFKKSCEDLYGLVLDEQKKVRIVTGNAVVSSKQFDTYEEADQYIKEKPYELIINTCLYIADMQKKQEQEQEQ